jgi:thiol-disulfide isomerase/thioredoxin
MFNYIKDFYHNIYQDKFKLILTILVILIVLIFLIFPSNKRASGGEIGVHFFYSPGCSHCADQKKFNQKLHEKYNVNIISHNITQSEEAKLFFSTAKKYAINPNNLGVPLTIVNGEAFIGFESENTSGNEIEMAIKKNHEDFKQIKSFVSEKRTIPFFGEFDTQQYSLPVLAIMLGLVDGFNPCAMWALIFLISLVVGLKDRTKLWFLIGAFVMSSGVLYFLFMTAWLNVFLLIGFIRPLVALIGGFSIWLGIVQIRDFFLQQKVCPLPTEQKQKIMERMRLLVFSPLTLATIGGIILLSFIVNLIEFVCSSFIPAIFTQTLALYNLPTWQYYLYIFLYIIFFIMDDLIIFSLAVFAITQINDKYIKWCRLTGGITLLILGVSLLLFHD